MYKFINVSNLQASCYLKRLQTKLVESFSWTALLKIDKKKFVGKLLEETLFFLEKVSYHFTSISILDKVTYLRGQLLKTLHRQKTGKNS